NIVRAAQQPRIVVAKIPHVGYSSYQRLDNDGEPARAERVQNLTEIAGRGKHDVRQWLMQALDFAVINGLHLLPEIPDFLFLVIARKKFAESRQRDHIGRQFVAPQNWLKSRCRSGNEAKPQVS